MIANYLDRLKNDGWFAFANAAFVGIAGYLLVEKLAQKYPCEKNETRVVRKLLSRLSFKKQKKEQISPAEAFVDHKYKPKEELIRDVSEFPIYKVVITGGPCAGKTTALQKINKVFTERGFKVMVVPDLPTLLVKCGATIRMDRFSSADRITFQKMLMETVMHLEDHYTRLASMNKTPGLVICQRGTMDPRAYIPEEEFESLLHEEGWHPNSIRDRRYDEIIFMVTAAEGAEKFYTLKNNIARHEGPDIAKKIDKDTLNAWVQHPRINIVPNVEGESFEDKIDRVIAFVEKITGNSSQHVETLRYKVISAQLPPSLNKRISKVIEVPLINNDTEKFQFEKAQKIEYKNLHSYNRVTGLKTPTKDVLETRRAITAQEFIRLADRLKDSSVSERHLQRTSFVHKNQFFTLSTTLDKGEEPQRVLEVTIIRGDEKRLDIPEFIQIDRKL